MVYALMIDDEQPVRESVQRTVSLAGLDLLLASNWDEGLTLFHIHSPDLVIVDYNLPGSQHGLKLISDIRKLRPSVRVILLSAYIDDTDVQEIEALGLADRAISKVTDPDAISAVLEEIRAAFERSQDHTNWVEFATSYLRVGSIDTTSFDDFDQRLKDRRGIS